MYLNTNDLNWLMNVDIFMDKFEELQAARRDALINERDAAEAAAKAAFERYKESGNRDDMKENLHQIGIARDCRSKLDELHAARQRFFDAFNFAYNRDKE